MAEDIAETIKFKDICTMLNNVKKASNSASKEKLLRRYYDSFQTHRTGFRQRNGIAANEPETGQTSFYCVLRCLIPNSDTARIPYGLQITSLGNVLIKILQIHKDSREAQLLYARSYSSIKGDYADTVFQVCNTRCKQEPSSLTLQQVHEMLDSIADDDRRNTEKVLTRLTEVAPAIEIMWFVRLLRKGMHLGITDQRIFAVLHTQAKEVYQRCANLKRVCCLLADNKLTIAATAVDSSNNGSAAGDQLNIDQIIEPLQHIRPMLCEVFPGDLAPIMASDVLYIETKMDGERFQLHFADGKYKYLSRNGIDYTYTFGDSADNGILTPLLVNLLPVGMQSIILDGEMMVWDTVQSRFRVKGENTNVKALKDHSDWRACFVVYDLLYYNGRSLLEMPYVQRTYKLRELIKEQRGVLQTMKPVKVPSIDAFKELFQNALDAHEEGVVLKKQNSVYRPGVRNGGGWLKVKADYIDGLTTEFDLLIIGGFYDRTRVYIESYLLGVLEYKSPQVFEVYSVGKVSNIIKQRKVLHEALKSHWRELSTEPPPLWYHYIANNVEGRPDVWIEPKESEILQIKAADLAPSAAFALSKSLHFPRIQAWRNDKVWHECMALKEYMQLGQGRAGIKKINKRELTLEDFTTKRKRIKLTPAEKRKLGIQAYDRKFNAEKVERTSALFDSLSFCILSADLRKGYTPEALKELVVGHGGSVVENPRPADPKCICIAGEVTYRVEAMRKSQKYNIVRMQWLLKACADSEHMLPLRPRDFVYAKEDVRAQFDELYDKYGDSYTDHVDVEELQELFNDIRVDNVALTRSEVQQLENELYRKRTPNFFRNALAYFHGNDNRTKLAKMLFAWRGGQCLDALTDSEQLQQVDYVFLNYDKIDKKKFNAWLRQEFAAHLQRVQVVTINWILHSHSAKRQLDICEYTYLYF